jgi:hypothetical protein
MTTYNFDDSEFAGLKGKTVVLTGCATGIGRAAANLAYVSSSDSRAFHLVILSRKGFPHFSRDHKINVGFVVDLVIDYGANLILGDWLEAEGEKLSAELGE